MKTKRNNIFKSVCTISLAAIMLTGYASPGVGAAAIGTETATGAYVSDDNISEKFGNFEYTDNGDSITITGYSTRSTEIIVPPNINGKPVTEIGVGAFKDCINLMNISLPYSVTKIGDWAFSNCVRLKNIWIPDSVTDIGSYIFDSCTDLVIIEVDENNKSYSSQDGVLFNKNKSKLLQCPEGKIGSYTIPDSVTEICGHAFSNCTSLTNIVIPDSVTKIRDWAFLGCAKLKSITIPDSVTEILEYAFKNCTGLTSIVIPDSVTIIGNGIFDYCTSLTSVTIGKSVQAISNGAFGDCTSLEKVTIHDGVKEIWGSSFKNCTSLTSIVIPDSVRKIGSSVFENCTNLKSITIPAGVREIGWHAFYRCKNLTIYGYKGSSAETYANENNIPFIALDDTDKVTLGDINGDGKVSIDDATLIQKYVAEFESFTDVQKAAADTNRDGKITVDDATTIQKFVAEIINSFE